MYSMYFIRSHTKKGHGYYYYNNHPIHRPEVETELDYYVA